MHFDNIALTFNNGRILSCKIDVPDFETVDSVNLRSAILILENWIVDPRLDKEKSHALSPVQCTKQEKNYIRATLGKILIRCIIEGENNAFKFLYKRIKEQVSKKVFVFLVEKTYASEELSFNLLNMAIRKNNITVVKFLVENCSNRFNTLVQNTFEQSSRENILHQAHDHIEIFQLLFAKLSHAKRKKLLFTKNISKQTVIDVIIEEQAVEVLQYLLQQPNFSKEIGYFIEREQEGDSTSLLHKAVEIDENSLFEVRKKIMCRERRIEIVDCLLASHTSLVSWVDSSQLNPVQYLIYCLEKNILPIKQRIKIIQQESVLYQNFPKKLENHLNACHQLETALPEFLFIPLALLCIAHKNIKNTSFTLHFNSDLRLYQQELKQVIQATQEQYDRKDRFIQKHNQYLERYQFSDARREKQLYFKYDPVVECYKRFTYHEIHQLFIIEQLSLPQELITYIQKFLIDGFMQDESIKKRFSQYPSILEIPDNFFTFFKTFLFIDANKPPVKECVTNIVKR